MSKLKDGKIYFSLDQRDLKKDFSRPAYNTWGVRLKGTTIALNDIWATEVVITDYKIESENYKLKYKITLWDHFWLDLPDMEKLLYAGLFFNA